MHLYQKGMFLLWEVNFDFKKAVEAFRNVNDPNGALEVLKLLGFSDPEATVPEGGNAVLDWATLEELLREAKIIYPTYTNANMCGTLKMILRWIIHACPEIGVLFLKESARNNKEIKYWDDTGKILDMAQSCPGFIYWITMTIWEACITNDELALTYLTNAINTATKPGAED